MRQEYGAKAIKENIDSKLYEIKQKKKKRNLLGPNANLDDEKIEND